MHKYEEVVQKIQEWIGTGVLKPGERLPSIRQMSVQSGCSAVTVQHAYIILESDGLIEARPRSGFYVARNSRSFGAFPLADDESLEPHGGMAEDQAILLGVAADWRKTNASGFGQMVISPDLLPSARLNIHLSRALREETHRPGHMKPFEGSLQLRQLISKRCAQRGMSVSATDIIITATARHALELALGAVTEPGDVVLVESPSSPPLFSSLHRRGLRMLEIYSHPTFGIDLDQFRYLLDHNPVKACVLMPVHHFPTGASYSAETMQGIVQLATERDVPIVENDSYGELTHGRLPVPSLKRFDTSDAVLQFGSFFDTLGPRYGLGWVITRRFQATLLQQSFADDPLLSESAVQTAIVEYISQRSFDRHLRKVREQLAQRMRRGLGLVSQRFPATCAVSRPTGGFMCWIRSPSTFNSLAAAKAAVQGFSFSPGPLFSGNGSFRNFIGLNFSSPWDLQQEGHLEMLADMVR